VASSIKAQQDLARSHFELASQHDAAAHHHRQAAFYLSTGESDRAKQHGITAFEHSQQAASYEQGKSDQWDDYDIDVKFDSLETSDVQPMITSYSLCTPTCGNTGTGNSFCCLNR
jgi:lantibiotic bacteriocin